MAATEQRAAEDGGEDKNSDGEFHAKRDYQNPDDIPNIDAELPDIVLYSHAPIFYWWPVWLTGFVLAGVSLFGGSSVTVDQGSAQFTSSSAPGILFVTIMLLVIIFTNIRLRGIYSVATILGAALIAVTLAWFGWWDEILGAIPELSVYMNTGFSFFSFLTAWFTGGCGLAK